MKHIMNVVLSNDTPPHYWDSNSLISISDNTITIHQNNFDTALNNIQKAARKIASFETQNIKLLGDSWGLEEQWAFTEGYVTPKQSTEIEYAPLTEQNQQEFDARLTTHNWVKNMIHTHAETITPLKLAEEGASFIKSLSPDNVSYRIVSGKQLQEENLMGIYTVGRGSDNPPALLELDFTPPSWNDAPPAFALVGKGISFDTGGYSLKPSAGMVHMKADMGGAATLTGALALAILRGLNKRVKLYLCCAENMVSGNAFRVSDIITYKNGVTVEILNTDAEGRLVMADGLILAGESKAETIIDAATLTGAAKTALGREYHALFTMDNNLQEKLLAAAHEEGEKVWPLPLEKHHRYNNPSMYADTSNCNISCKGEGGATSAAGFLSLFVPHNGEKNWAHFDLSGTMLTSPTALRPAGATAMGVRTIAQAMLK